MDYFSKIFLVLITLSSINMNAHSNGFERIVARHPYLAAFAAASVGVTVGIYAYKKLSKKPDAKKDNEVKQEAKSLFDSAARLISNNPLKSVAVASVIVGTGTAVVTFGIPNFSPVMQHQRRVMADA